MDEHLIGELIRRGVLTEEWEKPFRAVSRLEFLPDTLWARRRDDGLCHPVRRGEDPLRWADLGEGSGQVITQVDDGHPAVAGRWGMAATSSACAPQVMALMLQQLQAEIGDRVLEIGTGTGWNAALLACRLGGDRVVSVEIDPEVAAHARQTLTTAGFGEVTVITGNGSHGWPGEAPYHRVISTAACHTVPHPWVAQTRPGGRIVTPWAPQFASWALIALDVHPGHIATGAVVGTANLMRLRDQRLALGVIPSPWDEQAATSRTTSLTPEKIMLRSDVLMALSVWLPDCQARYSPPAIFGDTPCLSLSDPRTASWARLHTTLAGSGPHTVLQGGPRLLFDELEAAYQRWSDHGCPGTEAWQITVDEHGQRIQLM